MAFRIFPVKTTNKMSKVDVIFQRTHSEFESVVLRYQSKTIWSTHSVAVHGLPEMNPNYQRDINNNLISSNSSNPTLIQADNDLDISLPSEKTSAC